MSTFWLIKIDLGTSEKTPWTDTHTEVWMDRDASI